MSDFDSGQKKAVSRGSKAPAEGAGSDQSRVERMQGLRDLATAETLRQCRLFAALGDEDLRCVAGWVRGRQLARGDMLFREGEPTDACFVVQSGAIELHRITSLGGLRVLRVCGPGESLAEAALGGLDRYPASARALAASRVLRIPRREFVDEGRRRPELVFGIVASLSERLHHLIALVEDLTAKDATTRLAEWLLRRSVEGPTVRLSGSKGDLAGELGMTQETLSRLFASFVRDGLVALSGRKIEVCSRERLTMMAQRGCPPAAMRCSVPASLCPLRRGSGLAQR